MTCACESVHKFPCQFPAETGFFKFDDQKWCRFHLPLQNAAGNLNAKGRGDGGWEDGGVERLAFQKEVFNRLTAASNPGSTEADLCYVAFPLGFSFHRPAAIYPEIHGNFEHATFGNNVNFDGFTFGDGANFSGARFGGLAHFNGATFGDEIKFFSVIFQGSANFSAEATADAKQNFQHVGFSNTTFGGFCTFENRAFTTRTNFNGAVFHDLVSFHGCVFHPGMSFHLTKFLKTKGKNDDGTEELERSYRTLKLEMEKLRARNEEADFFALEMECRRQRDSVPWLERFAATAYKRLSDYGRAVDLPLIWLLILTYAAHYLYLPIALMSCNPGAGARFRFTLEQMFRPFYVWAKSPPGTGNCLVESNPVIIPILASLQSLATIALLTLFLLALRRRFKMD